MKTLMIAATAVALAFGTAALAEDEVDAATQEKVTALLTADGYEVRAIESEDGKVEAYALKDGKQYEIYFDADLKIVDTKESDD